MQGLGPGSLLGAAREAAYGEISAEARQLGKAEIVGMDTWEHEGEDESKMTPRERARYRARKGRRFLREADEARSPEQKASLKTDFRRQLGPSIPSIDPYGSYHLPLQYDTDRLPYGARPADDEPHIVLEYRELIPKLDKHCVRLFAEGGGKRYLEECRKTEAQVQAERLLLDADLSEREAIEIRDEAALAEAVAQAAMTQLDSENYSEALKKRLEDERGKIQDASRHDYTDIYRWDPDGIPLEEVDSDDGWDIDIEMHNANISCDLRVLKCCGAFTPSTRVVSGRAGGGWSLFRFRGRSDRVDAPHRKTFKVSRYNCQIPEDYLDLQRQFVALHPSQYRPLSIERPDGSLVQPNEKHFVHGETIVFREFGIYQNDGVERPSDSIRASLAAAIQTKAGIEDTVEAMTAVLAAKKAQSANGNAAIEAEIAAEEEALRKEQEFGLGLEADVARLEAKKAALVKANDAERAARSQEISGDEEALRAEKERLAAAKEAERLEAVHFLFDWERIHAEDCRDDLPLRDTVQPPVLTVGDKRQAARQSPRTEKAWQTSSLAARRAGQMRAGRSKPTPFNLKAEGGNGRGAGRWYVSGCGR